MCTNFPLFTRHWININCWSHIQKGLSHIKVNVYSIIKYRVEWNENSTWKIAEHLGIIERAWRGRGICNKTLYLKPKAQNLTRWAEDTIIFGAKRVLITWGHLVDLKKLKFLMSDVPIPYAVSMKLTCTESSLPQRQQNAIAERYIDLAHVLSADFCSLIEFL